MNEIKELFNLDYPTLIIGFFVLILGIDKIIFLLKKVKTGLRIKFGYDEDKETIEDRISKLEQHDKWQYEEISKITKGIDEIQERLLNMEIETMRKNILDFCSSLSAGQKPNREAFEYTFKTYQRYDELLDKYHKENNVINESMKFIADKYQEFLRNGDL